MARTRSHLRGLLPDVNFLALAQQSYRRYVMRYHPQRKLPARHSTPERQSFAELYFFHSL
jgi:hypothetical protein